MLEKFQQDNKAQSANRWFQSVNLNNADISQVETSIYTALSNTTNYSRWSVYPIAPYSEPTNLQDLFGDMINGAQQEILYQAQRIDNLYQNLTDTNNLLKSELDGIEKNVTAASDAVQSISQVAGDENVTYYWISDNFNSTAFVDLTNTTALVDTDYGQVTLGPSTINVISDFTIQVDNSNTNGIPGCNLEILNQTTNTSTTADPVVTLESANTKDVSNMLDQDPTTWFELERNFIPPYQNMARQDRAWVYTESGQSQSILSVTNNLDWKAIVQWPNFTDSGTDGTGVNVAEFVDLDSIGPNFDPTVKFVFNLVLGTPQQLSFLSISPFVRDSEIINVDSIQILTDTSWTEIVSDVILGSNVSTSSLTSQILSRTGTQSTGSLYAIPTDRLVSAIQIRLSSSPVSTPYGLAHAFQEVEQKYRTQRNYIFFNTVDTWTAWNRVALNSTTPTITSSDNQNKITGAITSAASIAATVGAAQVAAGAIGATSIGAAAGITSIGGTLGAAATWLGQALPIIGGLLLVNSLVGGLFNVQHSQEVIADVVAYDIFNGQRAGLGIRDLALQQTEYTTTSTFQSVKLQFQGDVTKIGLFVEQSIPDSWGSGSWITYYISEDGSVWTQLQISTDSTMSNAYITSKPLSEIYFKAVFTGNSADVFHSASLQTFSLQGLPGTS